MGILKSAFGVCQQTGQTVDKYTLQGSGGLTVSLLTYGATVQELLFAGKDLVLGFPDLEGYLSHSSYQGATIGRYANRIAKGTFALDGKTFDVGCNEAGRGHLHGGAKGFDKQIWQAEILSDGDQPEMVFRYLSPDGDQGYPGNLQVAVTFTVTADNTLRIAYEAETDAATVVNLTNHSYFNLNGYDGGDVLDTLLQIDADYVTPTDAMLIPTGELRPVAGTPFDFRTPKAIGQDIDAEDDQLQLGGGYDINYCLNGSGYRKVAVARSPKSGIQMTVYTDMPGVQFYAAGGLKEQSGKGGIPLYRRQGFCLETQYYPDSPNQPAFPSPILRPGQRFQSVTAYQFEVK